MAFEIESFANNLKKHRRAKNLTQQELAEKLFVSAQSVSKWECAQSLPELDKFCTISEILEVSMDLLIGNAPSATEVLIGVDGGGTKTEFILFRKDGVLLKRKILPATNPNHHNLETCLSILYEGFDELLKENMKLIGIFVGCAGFLTGDYGKKVKKALQLKYPRCKIDCNSDAMNLIACGSNSRRCVAAICGTGSVIYANENRVFHRLGGAGYLLDPDGSGFHIGRDVLRAALSEQDGIGEPTLLTPLTKEALGGTVWDNLHRLYQEGPTKIASLAPLAFTAYDKGDSVAKRILETHASYLANLIQTAADTYDCGDTVVLSGSILTGNHIFLQLVKKGVSPSLRFEIPTMPPVYGSCLLACELCEIPPEKIKENFDSQYKDLVKSC